MSPTRVYAIFLRQFFLLRQSLPRIFGIFYWSTFELLLWGIITKYLHSVGGENFSFITVIIGTVIFWGFFTRIQQGITVSFLEDVWSRNLINLFATPLRIGEYIIGLILVSMVNTLISFIAMFLVAWFLFSYNIFQFGFLILPYSLILFIFGWALGLLTTAVVMRYGPSIEILVWAVPTLIMPFSSIFYPTSALPKIIQPIAYAIPISYVFEGMRGIVHNGVLNTHYLVLAFILSLIYFIVAVLLLIWVYKVILRLGLFTKFMTD